MLLPGFPNASDRREEFNVFFDTPDAKLAAEILRMVYFGEAGISQNNAIRAPINQ